MSRIGRKPINIPAGVTVSVNEGVVTVKGPKGELTQKVHPNMTVEINGDVVEVKRPNDDKLNRSLHGLTRSLIHNMVIGVTEGYKKELEVNGVGYRVQKQGNKQTTLRWKFQILIISLFLAAISRRLVSSLLKLEKSVHQNHTRVRVLSIRMKLSVVRKVKPVKASN